MIPVEVRHESVYSPCETCYLRWGKQYTIDCDAACDYARGAKNNKKIITDLRYYLETNEEKGVIYIPKFLIEKLVNMK